MENRKLTKNEILKYFFEALVILLGVIAIAYGSCLALLPFLSIMLYAVAIIPFIIRAWIKQKNSFEKFDHLCNYLTNIIPIFLQRTKIRFTLGELFEICEGEIKEAIGEAIDYIDSTKNDPYLLENGLKVIEKRFNNSRVNSVHKFLLSVENTNSKSYKEIADNLNSDIEKWIKRSYEFQKDLKNRQIKLLILCSMTLIMNVMFVYVYETNEYFAGFVDIKAYQISTTVFIISVLTIIATIVLKLNGEWLIEDIKTNNQDVVKNRYREFKKGKQKIKALDIVITIILMGIGIYFLVINNRIGASGFMIIAMIFLNQKSRRYKIQKNYVSKLLTIEFPIWLREISLSLGNFTVLNAIESSSHTASYPMRRELRTFLDAAEKDPTSIKPYNDFLQEYNIDDVKASMRVLYAVNNVSKEDMKERIAKLIDRNQELLAKSEAIRNYDSIGGIEALGYVPTFIFSIHMIVSMLIMFDYMLGILGGLV